MTDNNPDYCNLEIMAEAKRYNAFLADAVRSAAGAAQHLVDFGAGAGLFAEQFRAIGKDVVCVEPEPRLQDQLRSRGLEVYPDASGLASGQADFVYTLNVLEHVSDDVTVLRQLAKALRPGGRIFVYVPAFMLLFSSMDRKVGHLRRYRRAGLRARLEQAGFVVERVEYVDSLGFPLTLLYRLIGDRDGGINIVLLRIYDRLMFPLSRALDRIANRLLGKNLLLVGRKPA